MRRPVLTIAVALSIVACGCGKDTPFRPLATGQCLPASAEVEGIREQAPPLVPCDEPHRYEVYATPTLDRDSWPGQAVVDEESKLLCYQRFADGTGHDPLTLPDGVKVLTIGPSESGFGGKQRDRRVECLVVLPDDREGSFVDPESSPGA